jgi:hypothetical protein
MHKTAMESIAVLSTSKLAPVVEWNTRVLEVHMPKGLGVRVSPGAPNRK